MSRWELFLQFQNFLRKVPASLSIFNGASVINLIIFETAPSIIENIPFIYDSS